MKKLAAFLVIISLVATGDLVAQNKRQLRKSMKGKDLYSPKKGRAGKGPFVNPIRKAFNIFNFSYETGTGFFDYSHRLSDVMLVRSEDPVPRLFIFPVNEFDSGSLPYNATTNWFNGFNPIQVNGVLPDDMTVRTLSDPIVYEGKGGYSPRSLKVSISIKKVDKLHLKTTGDRRNLDEDLIRVGAGLGFGRVKYRSNILSPSLGETIGDYVIPITEIRQRKLFATLAANMYTFLDFSLLLELEAGTWKYRRNQFDNDVTTYDPYYSVGLIFQKKFSKYFKVYMRPTVEIRNYTLSNGQISIPNKLTTFSLNFGVLLKYPTYPRNRFRGHQVQMEHVFQGKIYRGRSIFRRQNPRIGQNYKKLQYNQNN